MNLLQMTQPTSGGAVTAVTNCCANCVEKTHATSNVGLIYRFGQAGHANWLAGAAPHESG